MTRRAEMLTALVRHAEEHDLYEATMAPSVHEYLSTACWHGDHDYCQSMTGYGGAKRPGRCKFCDAQCTCSCHHSIP